MKWLPHNKGLANGLIVFGFGFGSLIFNFVETFIINPKNQPQVPDPTGATTVNLSFLFNKQEKFFPYEVVEHMPRVFLILAACYATMQLIGILCVSEPTEEEMKEIQQEEEKRANLVENDQTVVEAHPMDTGLSTCESLKTGKFWEIWFTMRCISMVNVFVSSFYKVSDLEEQNE